MRAAITRVYTELEIVMAGEDYCQLPGKQRGMIACMRGIANFILHTMEDWDNAR